MLFRGLKEEEEEEVDIDNWGPELPGPLPDGPANQVWRFFDTLLKETPVNQAIQTLRFAIP